MVSINSLQSEMNEGSFDKIDNMWMLNEEDAWTHLQTSVKSLSDFVSQLEENVDNSYDEMFHKINGLGNFIEKGSLDSFFTVNFAKFLRTPIFIEHLWWLLLNYFKHFSKILQNLSENTCGRVSL